MISRMHAASKAPDPWNVFASQLPRGAGVTESLRFALKYAVLAPSSLNTQPWQFRVGDRSVELHVDRSRWLRVADPARRELLMSCGAALHFLQLALRNLRCAPKVSVLSGGHESLLARIEAAPGPGPTPEEERLFSAIPRRRTHRAAFEKRAVPEALFGQLRRAAADQGAWLEAIEAGDRRGQVAGLVAEADRIRGGDPAYRRELAAWLRPNRGRHRDGIPGWAVGLGLAGSYLAPFVVRAWNWGPLAGARNQRLALDAPLLVVLGTAGEGPGAWLATGQALARMLLAARTQDVHAAYFAQVVRVPELRVRLREVLGRMDHPQLVLRVGFGRPAPPTPRRPAGEVQLLAAAYRSARPAAAARPR